VKIVNLLNKLEDTLNDTFHCPFGTDEEDFTRRILQLSCGHYASDLAWETNQTIRHGQANKCPLCSAVVKSVGKPIPMGSISEIIRQLRNESNSLLPGSSRPRIRSLAGPSHEVSEPHTTSPTKDVDVPRRTTSLPKTSPNQDPPLKIDTGNASHSSTDHSIGSATNIPLTNSQSTTVTAKPPSQQPPSLTFGTNDPSGSLTDPSFGSSITIPQTDSPRLSHYRHESYNSPSVTSPAESSPVTITTIGSDPSLPSPSPKVHPFQQRGSHQHLSHAIRPPTIGR